MALRIHDYRCDHCNERFEYVTYDDEAVLHPTCGQTARRLVSAPKLSYRQMGVNSDGGLTTAADKWARMHVEQAKIERKREEG